MSSTHEPLRLGLVGLGDFGQFTADVYASMAEVRIAGIVSRDPAKRAHYAAQWGAQGHESIETLVEDPAIECVVINAPPYLHSRQGLLAVHAGKHVFIEKPLTTELHDAETLLSAARERRVKVGVDYVMPYSELHDLLLRIVSSGVFGRVISITLENYASIESLERDHWFWDRAQSGGIFVEHGVHFFDLGARLASSQAATVAGFASTEADGRQDRVLATLQYASGAHATYYHAFDRPTGLDETVLHTILERGAIRSHGWIPTRMEIEGQVAPEALQELSRLIGGPLTVREAIPPPGVSGSVSGLLASATVTRPSKQEEYRAAIRRCMADFAHAIRDPAWSPTVTADDAYESLRVALAARVSAERE